MTATITKVPADVKVTYPEKLQRWLNDDGMNLSATKYDDFTMLGASANELYGGREVAKGTACKIRQLRFLGFEIKEAE